MRLGIINHHGRQPSGAEHALLLFLEQLPNHIEPVFFLFEEGKFTDMLRERYRSVTVVPMSPRIASATRKGLKWDAILDTLNLSRQLVTELDKAKVDVVLTNSMKAHVVGSFAAKALNLPCINYIHDLLQGSARLLIREISRVCGQERLVCSHGTGESLGLPNTTVVHSPIRLAEFQNLPTRQEARKALNLPQDDLPIVALVGRIAPWKGQDTFIRIASRVLQNADAHFAIIGSPIFGCDPAYLPMLENLVTKLNLQHRIHFVPWQTNLRNLYAAIDLSCNCSEREPFGRTTVESLACGVPVVCFDDAGVCEIYEHNHGGLKVPAGNEVAYAQAILSYLNEPALMADAKAQAVDIARRLDVGVASRPFLDAVNRVGGLPPRVERGSDPGILARSEEMVS